MKLHHLLCVTLVLATATPALARDKKKKSADEQAENSGNAVPLGDLYSRTGRASGKQNGAEQNRSQKQTPQLRSDASAEEQQDGRKKKKR